jgi:ABC-type iron transport system FetAB permease component
MIATIVTNTMVIIHLAYEEFSSRMPHIRKETTSKASCSQDQLKAGSAADRSGRKIRKICRQFEIH